MSLTKQEIEAIKEYVQSACEIYRGVCDVGNCSEEHQRLIKAEAALDSLASDK